MAVRPGDETGQTGGVDPRPDREQVIEALKAAFVQGQLGKDDFDQRVGQALAAYAELDELTADIPATRWTAPPTAERPQVTEEALIAASGGLVGMLTWYDVLGVLPGASPMQVQSAYQERARLLDPRMLNGAPSKVLKAADAARATVGEAWRILQDAAARRRYDAQLAVGRNGEGLDSAQSIPSVSGGTPSGRYLTADVVIAALEDLMTPHRSPPREVIVPDLRGLFMRSCLQVTGDLGLHVEMVQLTEHPMPVEGLVVDQSPLPGAEVRRSSTLTVEIWHPPGRSVVSRALPPAHPRHMERGSRSEQAGRPMITLWISFATSWVSSAAGPGRIAKRGRPIS
jgi:hypothetical protein